MAAQSVGDASLRTLPVYGAFVRMSFLIMLSYRLRYATGILTYLLFVSVHYFIWQAVYASQPPGAVINGFTLEQMITYISVGWVARSLYFSNIDYEMDEIVRTGQISTYLLRPVDFQSMMIAQAVGEAVFRLVFFSLPIGLVICLLFPVSPPAGLGAFLLFLLASCLGFLILAQLNFLTGLLAFSFKSIQGVIRAKYYLTQLCSGLLLPLAFFPPVLQTALDYLPFKTIAHTPLQFYLGNYTFEHLPSALLNQLVWLALLGALSWWGWRRAMTKLTLQGG